MRQSFFVSVVVLVAALGAARVHADTPTPAQTLSAQDAPCRYTKLTFNSGHPALKFLAYAHDGTEKRWCSFEVPIELMALRVRTDGEPVTTLDMEWLPREHGMVHDYCMCVGATLNVPSVEDLKIWKKYIADTVARLANLEKGYRKRVLPTDPDRTW